MTAIGSLFDQLRSIYFGQPKPMALSMHFDESGTHAGAPVLVIGGYLASDGQWASFDSDWKSILDDLSQYLASPVDHFHMTQFVGDFGAYCPLRDKPEIKAAVMGRVLDCIRKHTTCSFSMAMLPNDYIALTRGGLKKSAGSAYTFALRMCCYLVAAWAEKTGCSDDILYVMEKGNEHEKESDRFLRMMMADDAVRKYLRYEDHVYVAKNKSPGCQAADIIAYETYRMWGHLVAKGPAPKWPHVMPGYFGPRHLAFFLKQNGIESILVDSAKAQHPELPDHLTTIREIEDSAMRIDKDLYRNTTAIKRAIISGR